MQTFWQLLILCAASLSLMLPLMALDSSSSLPFTGFNASIGAGLEIPEVSTKGQLRNSIPTIENLTFNISRKSANISGIGSARLGYNLFFKDLFLIGLAGDAAFGNNHLLASTKSVESNSNLLIETNAQIKLYSQFSLLFKLGKPIGNRTLLYGLIGPRWGKFSLEFDARFHQDLGVFFNAALQTQRSYYKEGLLLGIGSEVLLTRYISLALEYAYTYYGHPKLPNIEAPVTQDGVIIPDGIFMFTSKLRAQSNDIMLRLGFYF